MPNDKKVYVLFVRKQKVEVSQEVYKAYYESLNREKYLERLSKKHNVSFEELHEAGVVVEDNIREISKETAEDEAIKNILIKQIEASLNLLNEEELFLIKEIFEKGVTEQKVAQQMKTSQQVIHYKKMVVLRKLRKILKIEE